MYYTEINNANNDKLVNAYGLVQQNTRLKNIYHSLDKMEYHNVVCYDNSNKIVGTLPFVLYNHPYGNIIHSTPYLGYGGVCMQPDGDAAIRNSLIEKLIEYGKERDVLLATICTEPFLDESDLDSLKYSFQPDFEHANFYQYIDITSDYLKNMTSKNRNNLKRNLRNANKEGIYLEEDYTEESLLFWYEKIYLKRLSETGGLIYPFDVFNELRKFGRDRVIIQYVMKDERIIGTGIFLKQQKSFDNYMRVIDPKYTHTKAGILIDNWSIEYAISKGYTFYNWQSCDREDSPIFNYKKTWGSKVGYHYYFTKKLNPIDKFKEIPLPYIQQAYPGIYVMPYSEFDNKEI